MFRVWRLLPPRNSTGAASSIITRAPHSQALNAAQSAALPPPTTRTSDKKASSVNRVSSMYYTDERSSLLMSRKTISALLLAAAILLALGAAVTLVPSSSLTISDLGYHTLCPFAPWSTLTLLFLAGLAWVVRQHIDRQPASSS